MQNKKIRWVSTILVGLVVIGGGLSFLSMNHGTPQTTKTVVSEHHRSPTHPITAQLISLSKRERTVPQVQEKQYDAIPVITLSGVHETVSVSNQPVVFVSEMDPTILQQFAGQKFKKEPVLIVAWPLPKQSLQQDLQSVEKEVKQLHLPMQVVELDASKFSTWMTGIPDTYVSVKGKVKEVPGVLPTDAVRSWAELFN